MDFNEAVAKAKNGEESGFQYLYEQTYQKNYYVALRYVKQEQAAQDVLQEAYIKAFSQLEQLENPEKFTQWMGSIVTRKSLDALKKKNIILFSQMGEEDEKEDIGDWIEDVRVDVQPEISVDQKETSRLVQEMIDTLSEEQKVCILSFYMEEMSVKEIAETLDVSENTVKSRLNYGRKKIQEKVLELEKKGTKLYGLAPIPFFVWLLGKDALTVEAKGLPTEFLSQTKEIKKKELEKDIARESAKNAGESLGKGAGKGIAGAAASFGTKKIAVALAVAVIAAGVGIGTVTMHGNQEKQTTEEENAQETTDSRNTTDSQKTPDDQETAEANEEKSDQQANSQSSAKTDGQVSQVEYEKVSFYEGSVVNGGGWAILDVQGADVPLLIRTERTGYDDLVPVDERYATKSGCADIKIFYWDDKSQEFKRVMQATSDSSNGALIDGYMTGYYGSTGEPDDTWGFYYLTYLPDEKLLVADLVGSTRVVETYEFDPKTASLHTVKTYLDDEADQLESKNIAYYSMTRNAYKHQNQVAE